MSDQYILIESGYLIKAGNGTHWGKRVRGTDATIPYKTRRNAEAAIKPYMQGATVVPVTLKIELRQEAVVQKEEETK